MANMIKMMQKAGQMKSKMEDLQERIKDMVVSGEASGNMVTCEMTGRFELKSININKDVINPDEPELLEDMVLIAVNDAHAKATKLIADETQKIMTDLGLPPGFELPF